MAADLPDPGESEPQDAGDDNGAREGRPGRVVDALQECGLCRGLGEHELRQVASAARLSIVPSGTVICRQDEPGDRMYMIASGRVKVSMDRGDACFQLVDYLERGDHVGEMAVLTHAPRTATVVAVMDTELVEIEQAPFAELMSSVPGFAANLSRSLGFRMRTQYRDRPSRHDPAILAMLGSTERELSLGWVLADALHARGESVAILSDRDSPKRSGSPHAFERLSSPDGREKTLSQAREALARAVDRHDRVLLAVEHDIVAGTLREALSQCERIWWLVEPDGAERSLRMLSNLVARTPDLTSRVDVLWILRHSHEAAPLRPEISGFTGRDFKVILDETSAAVTRDQQHSVERLVRFLRGSRVGIALGGGGARGLAHLGVLRALEGEGISFDLVAGTSSGALMGLAYAAGWEPSEALRHFKTELTSPGWVRRLPGAGHASMWLMFRLHRWERRLRKFFADWHLEQLRLPLCTVAVDLVSGVEVVRDTGDAVGAVLESINLPMISKPILRDGMALVDGGILNNLPADKLPERGANLVVGVDVVAKLPSRFGDNVPTTPTQKMRHPGPIETVLRVNEVQDYGISALRTAMVDLLIAPDTSQFDFSDFSRAHELADAGEAAAEGLAGQLRQMILDLEIR